MKIFYSALVSRKPHIRMCGFIFPDPVVEYADLPELKEKLTVAITHLS
jgi:hypothetical protein